MREYRRHPRCRFPHRRRNAQCRRRHRWRRLAPPPRQGRLIACPRRMPGAERKTLSDRSRQSSGRSAARLCRDPTSVACRRRRPYRPHRGRRPCRELLNGRLWSCLPRHKRKRSHNRRPNNRSSSRSSSSSRPNRSRSRTRQRVARKALASASSRVEPMTFRVATRRSPGKGDPKRQLMRAPWRCRSSTQRQPPEMRAGRRPVNASRGLNAAARRTGSARGAEVDAAISCRVGRTAERRHGDRGAERGGSRVCRAFGVIAPTSKAEV